MNKKIFISILFFMCVWGSTAQEKNDDWMFNPKAKLNRDEIRKEFEKIWDKSHKAVAGSDKIDKTRYFAKVDSVLNSYNQDSVTMTELVKMYRGALDLFTLEDPHFRIYPVFFVNLANEEAKRKNCEKFIKTLPCNLLQINDTLIVDTSINKNLYKGDIILTINGVNAKDLLNYTYRDRYINTNMMMIENKLMFKSNYHLKLIRNGKIIDLNIAGATINNYEKQLANSSVSKKRYGNAGYIAINNFDNNKYIIKQLRKLIKEVKANGGNNIIIDLRKNPGGRGEDFDKLLSIFTPKSKIDYQKSTKVMISKKTIPDYGYADSIGKLVTLPDSIIYKEIPLQPKLYMGKINYYVLISMDTGSMASSFANIMQYNNFGVLVGEPMRHNATRYGEVYHGNTDITTLIYSTVEIDEHTKAVNGIIKPDISIPYVAKEYAKGGDPMLGKLINMINEN